MGQASEEQEEKEKVGSEGGSAAVFTNVRASTPGRHGTPYAARKLDKRTETSSGKRLIAREEITPTTTVGRGKKIDKKEGQPEFGLWLSLSFILFFSLASASGGSYFFSSGGPLSQRWFDPLSGFSRYKGTRVDLGWMLPRL